jgi:hypothetical protein
LGEGRLEHAAGALGHAKALGGVPGVDLGAGAVGPVAQEPQEVGVEGGGQRGDVERWNFWEDQAALDGLFQ